MKQQLTQMLERFKNATITHSSNVVGVCFTTFTLESAEGVSREDMMKIGQLQIQYPNRITKKPRYDEFGRPSIHKSLFSSPSIRARINELGKPVITIEGHYTAFPYEEMVAAAQQTQGIART